ncbi:MAG: DUF4382 domain-containing protein [Pseudomonadota bacterium]
MKKSLLARLVRNACLGSVILLTACGGGDSKPSGTLSLNITDAPVDEASEVVVAFTGVTIKPQSGPAFDIDFVDENGAPVVKTIDLLDQQGPNSEPLLLNHELDAGHYNWMRLKVDMDQSFITLEEGGARKQLYIPSGDETGLKLNRGFEITDGGAATFTVDFDLRKSVLAPSNGSDVYKLKPTLRIVENANVGHLSGTVDSVARSDASCATTPNYAVYVFEGDVTPDDVDGDAVDPISSALVSVDTYSYAVGFLNQGTYTVAFTCEADLDSNEGDEAITFLGTTTVTITAGATTTHDFE